MAGNAHFPSQNEAVWANINATTAGDNTIVTGIAGYTIAILKVVLGCASGSAVAAALWNGPSASGTQLGTVEVGNPSVVLNLENNPFIIAAGKNFVINLPATPAACLGMVAYTLTQVLG